MFLGITNDNTKSILVVFFRIVSGKWSSKAFSILFSASFNTAHRPDIQYSD